MSIEESERITTSQDVISRLHDKIAEAAAPQAVQPVAPDDWRDQFSESVYEDLSAACNQDVPLEEYPARILNILDAIVGPRHPTVIKWRNDAIRSCIAIAYKYCSDPESYRYLKQDLEAMLAAPAHPAEGVPAQAVQPQQAMEALKAAMKADPEYAWSWHCAIWSGAHDEGLETGAANRAAARVMHMAFDCDTTKNANFHAAHLAATQPAAQGMDEERLRNLLCKMVDQLDRMWKHRDGNAPGHGHSIPGVWNSDNGELAGKKCAWCEVWQEALEVHAAAQAKQGGV